MVYYSRYLCDNDKVITKDYKSMAKILQKKQK